MEQDGPNGHQATRSTGVAETTRPLKEDQAEHQCGLPSHVGTLYALGLLPAQRNPLSLVEIKGGTTRPRRKKLILTPEQFQQLCNLLEEPYRTMGIIATCLGLRVSEILALVARLRF